MLPSLNQIPYRQLGSGSGSGWHPSNEHPSRNPSGSDMNMYLCVEHIRSYPVAAGFLSRHNSRTSSASTSAIEFNEPSGMNPCQHLSLDIIPSTGRASTHGCKPCHNQCRRKPTPKVSSQVVSVRPSNAKMTRLKDWYAFSKIVVNEYAAFNDSRTINHGHRNAIFAYWHRMRRQEEGPEPDSIKFTRLPQAS